MIRAYLLYTGTDGNSHVKKGAITNESKVISEHIYFRETPSHESFDWHNDPIPQYVVTLSGVLEFATKTGETFTITPGDILIATDYTGTGHTWRLLNDEPWKRVYLIFKPGQDLHFVEAT
jgi:quercetin dioxygenase-like cupin family protein